jgi:hypothetical protein
LALLFLLLWGRFSLPYLDLPGIFLPHSWLEGYLYHPALYGPFFLTGYSLALGCDFS